MKTIWNIIKKIFYTGLLFVLINIIILALFIFINPASSAFQNSNNEDYLEKLISMKPYQQKWVSISEISYNAPLAVIASEDQRFFDHWGIDVEQVEKALKENERRKRKRGASTISMQVAKNMFLWNDKNLIRKGVEAYYTVLMETIWSKKRIIEVYLNIAEMGKDLYGIESAARTYFKKSAIKLGAGEAALIASSLPNPKKRNAGRPSGYMQGRKGSITKQMNFIGGKEFIMKELY